MTIEELLGNFVNRVVMYFVIESLIQVIVVMSRASGSAGIVIGAVTIGAFVAVELTHWAGWIKGQG